MMLSFGESLKMARDRKGLTQLQVAKLANLSQSQLSRYESNDTCPTADIIKTLALHYNVSADFLFGFQKNIEGGGISVMETDVQIGTELLIKLSPENRKRALGYMDALDMLEENALNHAEESDSVELVDSSENPKEND